MQIDKATLSFLQALGANNNKEWFEAHRNDYAASKDNFQKFVQALYLGIREFDDSLKDEDQNIKIFRINRDVRFSKDKSPYKKNLAAVFSKNAKSDKFEGYYIHIEPVNLSGLGGGVVNLEPAKLFQVRKYISNHFDEFTDIFYDREFNKYFPEFGDKSSALKRTPQGFEDIDPSVEFIKNKQFTVWYAIDDQKVTSPSFYDDAIHAYKIAKPMLDFLKRASS